MSEHCNCTTGSEENGWHERRSEDCLRAEMREWGRVVAWMRGNSLARGDK